VILSEVWVMMGGVMDRNPLVSIRPLGSREEAEGYVAMICFKHGPPRRVGVELEWTVHPVDDPASTLDAAALATTLGPHAPATLSPDSPLRSLPRGSRVTVEPGGQVEISSPPQESIATLLADVDADLDALRGLLHRGRLVAGEHGIDALRPPHRILDIPRYRAMQSVFDRVGPDGRRMMCSTASIQVCLDAGPARSAETRWRALHAIGPAMVALFANSRVLAGRDTGWASARLRSVLGTYPPYTSPPALDGDPAGAWAALAMSAPVICLRRRDGAGWDAPPGLTFGDWADGALPTRPTVDDLDYHLTTLFPPVRPRGHLEVRYLDAQPGRSWRDPVLLLAALMQDEATVDDALVAAEPAAGRWLEAARDGLDDELVLECASALVDIGCDAMCRLDVDSVEVSRTTAVLERRIVDHSMRRHTA
jgi:glutamate--cysteine ligase